MTSEEAIEAIKCNWPDSRYTILRDALDMAISALRQQDHFRDLTKKVEPLTNAQKIRSMSDEELGVWICKHALSCGCCVGVELCRRDDGIANGAVKWLQMQAEEDKHEDD